MFTLIIYWKILNKTDKKQGWKLLIPFYGSYTVFKAFYTKKAFWTLFIGYILVGALSAYTFVTCDDQIIALLVYYITSFNLVAFVSFVASQCPYLVAALALFAIVVFLDFVFHIFLTYYIGRSFRAKPIHCILLLFFPILAALPIAIDDRFIYRGPKGKAVKKVAKKKATKKESTKKVEEN